jgi:hypothetical protein
MQIPSQNSRFLCNRLGKPLKASRWPVVSRSFGVAAAWTTELHYPDVRSSYSSSTWSWISNEPIWEGSARLPNNVATRPDATQCSRIFQVSFTDAERSDSIDRPNARSSRPNVVLFCEELGYSRMLVTEDRPDAAKWSSELYSPESEFEQY